MKNTEDVEKKKGVGKNVAAAKMVSIVSTLVNGVKLNKANEQNLNKFE